jgi:hypothetical protein
VTAQIDEELNFAGYDEDMDEDDNDNDSSPLADGGNRRR